MHFLGDFFSTVFWWESFSFEVFARTATRQRAVWENIFEHLFFSPFGVLQVITAPYWSAMMMAVTIAWPKMVFEGKPSPSWEKKSSKTVTRGFTRTIRKLENGGYALLHGSYGKQFNHFDRILAPTRFHNLQIILKN